MTNDTKQACSSCGLTMGQSKLLADIKAGDVRYVRADTVESCEAVAADRALAVFEGRYKELTGRDFAHPPRSNEQAPNPSDGQAVIYQTSFINDQWRDVDRAEYDRAKGLRADLARIVYAAPIDKPAEQTAQERIDAEQLSKLLPCSYYMDPPDGGSVTLLEQTQRMAHDAKRYRCLRNCYSRDERTDVVDQWDGAMDESLDAAIEKDAKGASK